MVHPAMVAITIGVGIGVSLYFLLFGQRQRALAPPHAARRSRSQNQTGYVYCVVKNI